MVRVAIGYLPGIRSGEWGGWAGAEVGVWVWGAAWGWLGMGARRSEPVEDSRGRSLGGGTGWGVRLGRGWRQGR